MTVARRTLRLAYTMAPRDMTLITCITFATATLPFALTYTNMLVIDELIKVASQNAPDLAYIITYTFITISVVYHRHALEMGRICTETSSFFAFA